MEKRCPVQLPDTVHRKLKIIAAQERTSITALILAAMEEVYGIIEETD